MKGPDMRTIQLFITDSGEYVIQAIKDDHNWFVCDLEGSTMILVKDGQPRGGSNAPSWWEKPKRKVGQKVLAAFEEMKNAIDFHWTEQEQQLGESQLAN
jgi:hypothetical protein